ncbi:hypothetical protein ACI78R_14205 [Geodermatophilus sp. SYSU D01106]
MTGAPRGSDGRGAGHGGGRDGGRVAGRERLVALLVLGIGAVLLLTSVTWFGSGRSGVGAGQLVLAAGLLVAGAVLLRRSRAR